MTEYAVRDALLCGFALRERRTPGFHAIAVRAVPLGWRVSAEQLLAATTLAATQGYVEVVGADDGNGQVIRLTALGWAEGERLLASTADAIDAQAPQAIEGDGDSGDQR